VALATDVDNPVIWLFNLGTAGVWLASYMTGWSITKGEHNRVLADLASSRQETTEARAETAEERAKNEKLRDDLLNKTIPTLAGLAHEVPRVTQPSVDASRVDQALTRLDDFLDRAERRRT
jgi:hypothetical protein